MNLAEIYAELGHWSIAQGSDKGALHSYIDYYEAVLAPYRNKRCLTLLEIGVATGASLLLWKRYFDDAVVIGVDIDLSQLWPNVVQPGIWVFHGDATDESILRMLPGKHDIIIDDGSHDWRHQARSFWLLSSRVKPGGLYVIEDVASDVAMTNLLREIPSGKDIDLRHVKGRYDDRLLQVNF